MTPVNGGPGSSFCCAGRSGRVGSDGGGVRSLVTIVWQDGEQEVYM